MNRHLGLIAAVIFGLSNAAHAEETPPRRLTGEAPRYDGTARQLLKEGWVHVQGRVTVDGTVEEAKVLTSYPKGLFDDEALKAFKTWKYRPRMVDGAPTEEPVHRVALIFFVEGERGVYEQSAKTFQRALRALRNRDLVESEKYVAQLRERYREEKFNLTEVARYYQFESILASDKQDYIKAADWIEMSLKLAQFLDNRAVVDSLHELMVVAFGALGQYHNAVDYYESWRRETTYNVSPKIAEGIAELKSKGFGRGREFEIATYKEIKEKSKLIQTKDGKVPPSPEDAVKP